MNRMGTASLATLVVTLIAAAAQGGNEARVTLTEKQFGNQRVSVVRVPKLRLPVVIYRDAVRRQLNTKTMESEVTDEHLQALLNPNGWHATWMGRGVAALRERHRHSTSPEVVAVIRGGGRLRLSADDERDHVDVELESGDLVFLPPDAWHQGLKEWDRGAVSRGAYPFGAKRWDWKLEVASATEIEDMKGVPVPRDPVFGDDRLLSYLEGDAPPTRGTAAPPATPPEEVRPASDRTEDARSPKRGFRPLGALRDLLKLF